MPSMPDGDALTRARAAFERRDWAEALDAFAAAPTGTLTPTDVFHRADAAWWVGHIDDALAWYEVAFRRHLDGDEPRRAALAALLLGAHASERGDDATGSGWTQRARRLLDDTPEGPEHGYPLYWDAFAAMGRDDLDAAIAVAHRMQELGRRHHEPDLIALGAMAEGRARLKAAETGPGMALLDEAMVMAVSDELHPLWTGAIYCHCMDACRELHDLERAAEWTEATTRWCDAVGEAVVYRGICRVHRAQVFQLRGDWDRAEDEARRAGADMPRVHVGTGAEAHYEVGEIRRLRGDLDGAEAAYRRAHELGRDPQPGLALLRARQGKPAAAVTSLTAALAGRAGDPLGRVPLAAALVGPAVAVGEVEVARAVAAELRATAADHDSPGLRAIACQAAGQVHLADEDPGGALAALREACRDWHDLDVPHEAARTRLLLARALAALGDLDAARLELLAADAAFDRLGAVLDREEVRQLEHELAGTVPAPDGLSPREVEVLQHVATGLTNQQVADALSISPSTVARHVANIFLKIDVSTRTAATVYAYEHGLVS